MSFLKKGDKIGIIAPSVGLKDKDINPSLNYFKKLKLIPVLASNLQSEYRYMAGTDNERAEVITSLFQDKDIKALFCLRGGAGATRMLPYLNYNIIKKNPKPVIGLSDSTALQNALIAKANIPSFTGFLPIYDLNNKNIDKTIDSSLKNALFEDKHQIASGKCQTPGTTEGEIIGGCLSVFLYLCGTPYLPDLSNKILLLEDTDEKTYKVDLMLSQIKQQKGFNKLKGIIIGKFSDCPQIDKEDGTIEDCIKDFTKDLSVPIITDFAYGHIPSRHLIPLGIKVKMCANKNKCILTW